MIVEIIEYDNLVSVEVIGVTLLSVNEYNIPAGMSTTIFTEAGQLLGSTDANTPVAIPAPTVEGQLLIARLGQAGKMTWESVDLSQMVPTAVKTAAYTAANSEHVLVNSSGASGDFAITLPASPSAGNKVRVTLVAGHATHKVTIDRNGSLVMGGTDMTWFNMQAAGLSYYFEYTGASLGWVAMRSYKEIRYLVFPIADAATTPTTGDGKVHLPVPPEFNGWNIVTSLGCVTTVSSSGTPTFALRRERSGSAVDVFSTNPKIDVSEKTTVTAATPAVINTSNDDLATGDILYGDLDVAGTGAKGHMLLVGIQPP